MQLMDFLSLLAQGLLIIALPIVIAAAIQHLRVMTNRLRADMSQERQEAIDWAVRVGVQFAERVGLLEKLVSSEKRKRAIEAAQKFLAERGVNIDLDSLITLVEAEVQKQFHNPAPPVDAAQARQALIDSAVQSAVQAAEQSGLSGLIQNVSTEKKAYAMQMAAQYLKQHNITVGEQLMSGLVESQLLIRTLVVGGQSGTLSGSTPVGGTGVAGSIPGDLPPI
jgi:hypothetical protein